MWDRLKRWARHLEAETLALWFCCRHPATPLGAKIAAGDNTGLRGAVSPRVGLFEQMAQEVKDILEQEGVAGDEGSVLVAVSDPGIVLFTDELRRSLGMPVRFAVVAPASAQARARSR